MTGRQCLAILAVASLAWLTGPAGPPKSILAQGTAELAERAAEKLFARRDIQFAFPAWERMPDGREREPAGDWRIEERDLPEGEPWRLTGLGDLAPFWSLLVWMTAICCGLLIAYWLLDTWAGFAWPGSNKRRDDQAEPDRLHAHVSPARILDDAERLASDGRFAEAIHALLIHGLMILRRRLGGKVAAALTSREILALSELPDNGKGALRDLVAWVELTHFGERAASQDDYRRCRGLFEDFARAIGPAR